MRPRESARRVLAGLGWPAPPAKRWPGGALGPGVSRNAPLRLAGAPDGLPIPPDRLMYLVAGTADAAWFLEGRRAGGGLDPIDAFRGRRATWEA